MGNGITLSVFGVDAITNAGIADNAFSDEHFDVDSTMKMILGTRVARAAAVLPETATEPIFTIAGGDVMIRLIYGVVGTVIQTQACNYNLQSNPTIAGASLDLCAVLNISAKAAGSYFGITGTLANAMTNGVAVVAQTFPLILPAGTIDHVTSATNTGTVAWYLWYVPLTPGATIVAA